MGLNASGVLPAYHESAAAREAEAGAYENEDTFP
jgi:hypothetical protein